MTLADLKREDFTETFEAQGGHVLMEYMINTYYTPYASMAQAKAGRVKEYMPNSVIKQLDAEGLNRKHDELKRDLALVNESIAASPARFEAVLAKKQLSAADIEEVLAISKELFERYLFVDPLYWDSAYQRGTPEDKQNTALVQQYKNVIRDQFNPFFFGETSYLVRVLNTLGAQTDIQRADLEYYTPAELVALCGGARVPASDIAARKQAYIIHKDDTGAVTFLFGAQALVIIEQFDTKPDALDVITGKTAHTTGQVVRAKVRIVERDYTDTTVMQATMAAMEQGEVLVTQTTDPEMMPALRKASAAVTDIGGMLSHTAITARELNIPCIVDTKVGTRVLKTGDLVEVDATQGVVRILERV